MLSALRAHGRYDGSYELIAKRVGQFVSPRNNHRPSTNSSPRSPCAVPSRMAMRTSRTSPCCTRTPKARSASPPPTISSPPPSIEHVTSWLSTRRQQSLPRPQNPHRLWPPSLRPEFPSRTARPAAGRAQRLRHANADPQVRQGTPRFLKGEASSCSPPWNAALAAPFAPKFLHPKLPSRRAQPLTNCRAPLA